MHDADAHACTVPGCPERAAAGADMCAAHVLLVNRMTAWLLTAQPSDFGSPVERIDRA